MDQGITAILLAGGKSRRMGTDKTLLELEGETLLHRVLRPLRQVSQVVILVTAEGTFPMELPAYVQVVADLYPGTGSLGGIYSGLAAMESFLGLVVACDMPFLNADLLRYMIEQAPGFDVVVPSLDGRPEPLHALYSKNCLRPIEELLKRGQLKIIGFFPKVRVRYLEEEEMERFDGRLSLFNINTPQDLKKSREMLALETAVAPKAGSGSQ